MWSVTQKDHVSSKEISTDEVLRAIGKLTLPLTNWVLWQNPGGGISYSLALVLALIFTEILQQGQIP